MSDIEKMKGTMTKEEAIALAKSEWWKEYPEKDVALAQLKQPKLCIPFGEFQEIVNKAIGRGVFTHEFAEPSRLIQEIESPGSVEPEHPLESLQRIRKEAIDKKSGSVSG